MEDKLYTFVKYEHLDGVLKFGLIELYSNKQPLNTHLSIRRPIIYKDIEWIEQNINKITNLTLYNGKIQAIGESWKKYPYIKERNYKEGRVIVYRFKDDNGRTLGYGLYNTEMKRITVHDRISLLLKWGSNPFDKVYNGEISAEGDVRPKRGRYLDIKINQEEFDKLCMKPCHGDVLHTDVYAAVYTINGNEIGWTLCWSNRENTASINIIHNQIFGIPIIDITRILEYSDITIVTGEFINKFGHRHEESIANFNIKTIRMSKENVDNLINKVKLVGLPNQKLLVVLEEA